MFAFAYCDIIKGMAAGKTTTSLTDRPPVTMRAIRRLALQIAERVSARKIVLFGSYALGEASPDSDVDLLVITDRPPGPDESLRIRRSVDYQFPLDLIVYDAKRVQRRIAAGDYFLQDAIEGGKVLYERPGR